MAASYNALMSHGEDKANKSGISRGGVLRLVFGIIFWIGIGIVGANPLEFRGGMLLVLLSMFGIGGCVGGFVGEYFNRTQTSYFIGTLLGGVTFIACVSVLASLLDY